MTTRFRLPTDDFYCFRFAVWYDTLDCAVRTRYRTAPGCRDCAQGRENARMRAADLPGAKPNRDAIGFADLVASDVPGDVEQLPFLPGKPRLVHSR